MKLTVKFKILPTKEQEQYLEQTLTEYINTVNNIVPIMINGHKKLTSKDIKANLPSAVKNNVSVIRLENLKNIRNTTRTSRKNEKNLHTCLLEMDWHLITRESPDFSHGECQI